MALSGYRQHLWPMLGARIELILRGMSAQVNENQRGHPSPGKGAPGGPPRQHAERMHSNVLYWPRSGCIFRHHVLAERLSFRLSAGWPRRANLGSPSTRARGGDERLNSRFEGISRRAFVRNSASLLGGAYLCALHLAPAGHAERPPAAQAAAGAPDEVEQMIQYMGAQPVIRQQLRRNIFVLSGPGGNIGLLTGPDGSVVVDSGLEVAHERILAAVAGEGAGAPQLLINTHLHFDHTGGNLSFHAAGARILAQDNVRARLSMPYTMFLYQHTFPPLPPAALPTVTFASSTRIYANGEQLEIVGVPPAHTDGDAFVHFTDSDVIQTGDLLFNGFYPLVDMSAGGRMQGLIAAADKILEIAGPKTILIPGHGPVGATADLRAFRNMMATVTERLTKRIAAGDPNKAIVADRPTSDFDARWGGGFMKPDQFVTMACDVIRMNH